MKKIKFSKNYTRDTSLIIQGLWFKAHNKAIKSFIGNNKEIFGIDHLSDGAIEIWENDILLKKLKKVLIKESFNSHNLIIKVLKEAEIDYSDFEIIWRKKYLLSKSKLLLFISQVEKMMFANLIYSYLGVEKDAQSEVFTISKRLRATDHFFASSDKLIRNSIGKIYPEFLGLEMCITLDELKKGTLPSLGILKKRFISFFQDSKNKNFLGDFNSFKNKYKNYEFFHDKMTNTELIKGQIANKGKIIGRVIIIRRNSDVKKIKKGDIVVSPMTTPELVSGLKKSSGIITDEGGLLCHAAVISRELNIPCIIATKLATKQLKDGDRVEVDANRGEIRKINFK